jgi:hypothetical protein
LLNVIAIGTAEGLEVIIKALKSTLTLQILSGIGTDEEPWMVMNWDFSLSE